jgi:hypothetical protein
MDMNSDCLRRTSVLTIFEASHHHEMTASSPLDCAQLRTCESGAKPPGRLP